MTVRVKVSHMDKESAWDLIVSNTFRVEENELVRLIRPGGSAEFLVHSEKNLIVRECLIQKSGEAEASPS